MSMEQDKQHAFDAYCKRLIKNEAADVMREYARQGEREVSFFCLTRREWQSLQYIDHYQLEGHVFTVLNTNVEIRNEDLGRALAALTPERRDIILLAYLLDMKDEEIARQLQVSRSTVQYRRTNILEELKKLMEGYHHG